MCQMELCDPKPTYNVQLTPMLLPTHWLGLNTSAILHVFQLIHIVIYMLMDYNSIYVNNVCLYVQKVP